MALDCNGGRQYDNVKDSKKLVVGFTLKGRCRHSFYQQLMLLNFMENFTCPDSLISLLITTLLNLVFCSLELV